MLHTLYNLLPDTCGIFLAAVSIALALVHTWADSIHPKVLWVIAGFLVLLGVGAMISSHTQKRDADAAQATRDRKIDEFGAKINDLEGIERTYGPKLDQLIKNPQSDAQRDRAIGLRAALASHNSQCVPDPSRKYKCDSNAELGQWLIDEGEKLKAKELEEFEYVRNVRQGGLPDEQKGGVERAAYFSFTNDIEKCCIDDMTELRKEALARLGPADQDNEEQDAWEQVNQWRKAQPHRIFPGAIRDYFPFLEKLGSELKGKSSS